MIAKRHPSGKSFVDEESMRLSTSSDAIAAAERVLLRSCAERGELACRDTTERFGGSALRCVLLGPGSGSDDVMVVNCLNDHPRFAAQFFGSSSAFESAVAHVHAALGAK